MDSKATRSLCVQKMNRHQNHLEYILAFRIPGEQATERRQFMPNKIYDEVSKTYIDVNDKIHFLKDGRFVILSDKNGYSHIYLG